MEKLKTIYVQTFTKEPLKGNEAIKISKAASSLLSKKYVIFKEYINLFTSSKKDINMHISSAIYHPLMSTPYNMQLLFSNWIKNQHDDKFDPISNKNFFTYEIIDNHGENSFVYFYFFA